MEQNLEFKEEKIGGDWLVGTPYDQKLKKIKDAVKKLYEWSENYGPLAFYTPHGIEHFQAVENILYLLLPNDSYKELSIKERFYLISSAWLHDIGMFKNVARDIHIDIVSDDDIRETHHITSAKYIVEHNDLCGVDEEDKTTISELCKYHRIREDINNCPNETIIGMDPKPVKLRLLASYLRLADSLDIGNNRISQSAYALCLAYNIPTEIKFQWIKSRLVNGIKIDAKNHKITIEFKIPSFEQDPEKIIENKLKYIIKVVLDGARDELFSVSNVLIKYNISYFLDIEKICNNVYLSPQMILDLRELVTNYDIIVHPSATRLLQLIMMTISNVSGFHLQVNEEPKQFEDKPNYAEIKNRLEHLLKTIEKEIIRTRPCHLGLKSLVNYCNDIVKKEMDAESYKAFKKNIDIIFKKHFNASKQVRNNAKNFFKKFYEKEIPKTDFVILLYGYSELVIKAICGFRDCLLNRDYPEIEPKTVYNSEFEKNYSKKFLILICEGQPKTQTGDRDRLLYHDGSLYALTLKSSNFPNLIIVPDITVGNILENIGVDMVMVGANGFTGKYFKHSAGHSSIINLSREYRLCHKESKLPHITLVTSSEKYSEIKNECGTPCENIEVNSEGCLIWECFRGVIGREKFWITKDIDKIKELAKEEIHFFNPREDVIPIGHVDHIISDNGYYEINPEMKDQDDKDVIENINKFVTDVKLQPWKPGSDL